MNRSILPTGVKVIHNEQIDSDKMNLEILRDQENMEAYIRLEKKLQMMHWKKINEEYNERKELMAGNAFAIGNI